MPASLAAAFAVYCKREGERAADVILDQIELVLDEADGCVDLAAVEAAIAERAAVPS